MTIWTPVLEGRDGARYLAIADVLAEDVAGGRLPPGTRLPTHRDLAEALGVTVGTVSRAYREARNRGLIVGEVGRGTFVRAEERLFPGPGLPSNDLSRTGVVDLSLNFLRLGGMQSIVTRSLEELCRQSDTAALLGNYHPQAGILAHRVAGARWIARGGFEVDPDDVLVCNGAQHAITVALMATTRPGEAMLASRVTYPAVVALARSLHLKLHAVEIDADGLIPESLESACRVHKARTLYTMPNLHNPTTRVMPQGRRRAIADVADRHGLTIIEDDVYGFLLGDPPPPIIADYPHRGFLVASVSKSLAPGLRVGYLAQLGGNRTRLLDTLWATTIMAPPLMAELASRWIDDGTAALMIEGRRSEARARQAIAQEELACLPHDSHPEAMQCWVPLPEPWNATEFVRIAAERGVLLNSSDIFAVGRDVEPAVRVALGGARTRDELRGALRVVAELAGSGGATRVI